MASELLEENAYVKSAMKKVSSRLGRFSRQEVKAFLSPFFVFQSNISPILKEIQPPPPSLNIFLYLQLLISTIIMLLITHLMKIYTHEKLHLESSNRPLQDAKNYHI